MLSLKALVGVAFLMCLALPALAADEKPAAADQTVAIAKLVEQLDADEFTQRQAASEKLAALGKPAIEALAKAAAGESLEVTSRAMEILKKLYQAEDEATKKAAQTALEALAKGSHAPSARRAKEVLKITDNKTPATPDGQGNIIVGGGGIQIIQGNIQINAGGKGKKASVKIANGTKEIDVEEGDKKYHIVENDKGIKAEITTKKDGKDVTEKIEAKDGDELKKKNKEAYDVYKEYGDANAGGAIQVQIGGGAVPMPAIARAVARRGQVDTAKMLLKSWAQSLQRMTGEEDLKGAPQESIDELKKNLDELKTQIADLEKRIKAAEKSAEKGDKPATDKPAAEKPAADKPVEKVIKASSTLVPASE